MISCIIIDDEPSAVNVLSILLKKSYKNEVEIIATSHSATEGRKLIEELDPDLVFLDIEMPGMTGIELAHSLYNPRFRLVFVTAYDAYALEAFRLNVIDYLLKPMSIEDVVIVIEKVKKELKKDTNIFASQLQHIETLLKTRSESNDKKIGIGMADKIVFVNLNDIIYCEASGAYTTVYLTGDKKLVSSKALGEFEAQLHLYNFLRIHHSYLINLNSIKEFQRNDGGHVIMDNEKKLEVSQRKRKLFLSAIDNLIQKI